MKALKEVLLLQPEHKDLIRGLLHKLWDGTRLADVLRKIGEGDLYLFATVDNSCLVLTEVIVHPKGKELFIYGITGRGILKNKHEVVEDFKELAKRLDCKWVGAEALRDGWTWLAKGLGFEAVSTRYLKEIH